MGAAAARGDRLDRGAWSAKTRPQAGGRSKAEVTGETALAGVTVEGRVDRIDRLADGGLAIIDYKTGQPPTQKTVDAGFALQLGLLGLIGRAGGFEGVTGDPEAFEYWSLARYRGKFGQLMRPDKDMAPGEFLDHAYEQFRRRRQQVADRRASRSRPSSIRLTRLMAIMIS